MKSVGKRNVQTMEAEQTRGRQLSEESSESGSTMMVGAGMRNDLSPNGSSTAWLLHQRQSTCCSTTHPNARITQAGREKGIVGAQSASQR